MLFLKKIVIAVLILESRLILAKYRPFIITVTGSVGKTSTKDAIYTVLTEQKICDDHNICFVRKSEKSFNSEIGLPLTVIGVPNAWRNFSGWVSNILTGLGLLMRRAPYPDCLILEMGADHPGDIRRVASWLRPDIAVITKISRTPVHVEFFSSPEEVFEEKAALARAVKKSGTLVLFADDDNMSALAVEAKEKGVSVITFGLSEAAEVRGSDEAAAYETADGLKVPAGLSFTLSMAGQSASVSVKNIIGKAYTYPLLAAAAVGKARSMSLPVIAQALNSYKAPPGRMNVIPGANGSVIIDDTYNSSPDAAAAALQALQSIEASGRKIAILGDMMELGKYAAEEHRNIGREAAAVLAPVGGLLIAVGPRSRATADEAVKSGLPSGNVSTFDSSAEAAPYVASLAGRGDIILVKGSQSPRLERITKALLREPERAPELLVRQEKEWLEKA